MAEKTQKPKAKVSVKVKDLNPKSNPKGGGTNAGGTSSHGSGGFEQGRKP
jgi:hypothetical protein